MTGGLRVPVDLTFPGEHLSAIFKTPPCLPDMEAILRFQPSAFASASASAIDW